MTTLATDLPTQLTQLGLHATALGLDDFLARATKSRWSPQLILEEMARAELRERSRRSVERRLRLARIGRFRPMADFDWNWPKKIDRATIERASPWTSSPKPATSSSWAPTAWAKP